MGRGYFERHSVCPKLCGHRFRATSSEGKDLASMYTNMDLLLGQGIFKATLKKKNECGTFLGKVWTSVSTVDNFNKISASDTNVVT